MLAKLGRCVSEVFCRCILLRGVGRYRYMQKVGERSGAPSRASKILM